MKSTRGGTGPERWRRRQMLSTGLTWAFVLAALAILTTPVTALGGPTQRFAALDGGFSPALAVGPHVGDAIGNPERLLPSGLGVLTPISTTRLAGHSSVAPPPDSNPGQRAAVSPPSFNPAPASTRVVPTAPVLNGTFSTFPQTGVEVVRGAGFQGVDSSNCGCDPPDVQDAVGPANVVEMVNVYVAVWDRNGTQLANESLNTFYGTTNYLSDPRIVYDNLSDRFFASMLEFNISSHVGSIVFAVSDSSSAAGNWSVYRILHVAGGELPDQPILGMNSTLLGIGANIFGNGFGGAAEFWLVNKSEVLEAATTSYTSFGPYTSSFSIHPARTLDRDAPFTMLESVAGSPGTVRVYQVHGGPPAGTSVGVTNLTIGSLTTPPAASTPGGGIIDAATVRMADAILSNGRLYLTFGDQCYVGSANRSCVRLVVLNTTPAYSVAWDFDLAYGAASLFYPAISLDGSGNLLVVFGVSSSSIDPGVAAAAVRLNFAEPVVSPYVWIHQGSTGRKSSQCYPNPTCRYGDYFGSGTDPSDGSVWISGEYLDKAAVWSSWLAPVRSEPRMSATFTAPSSADVGVPVNLTVQVNDSLCSPGAALRCSLFVPLGDGSTYSLVCANVGGSLNVRHAFRSAGLLSVDVGGNLTVYSSADCSPTNLTGTFALPSQSVTVSESPSVAVFTSRSGAGDVGELVNFLAYPQNGTAPFSYAWSDLPPGCASQNTSTLVCVPSGAGLFGVAVLVSDQDGGTASGSVQYEVSPAPVASLTAAPPSVDQGANVTFTGSAQQGSGVFTYSWLGLPLGCPGSGSPTYTCVPAAPGIYNISLVATDTRGVVATGGNLTLAVASPLSVQLGIYPRGPSAGTTVTITATISGGVPPYQFSWGPIPSGCRPPSKGVVVCVLSQGDHRIGVTVSDSGGGSAHGSTTIAVSAAASLFGGLTIPEWGGLVVAVIAASAIGTVWALRRKPRSPPR